MAEKENQPKEKDILSSTPHEGLGGSECGSGKSEWPEVVGLTAEEAERKIREEVAASIQIQVVQPDSIVTADFRTDRIRIFVDSSGKVDKPPRIG